jgi:hypothetical protein
MTRYLSHLPAIAVATFILHRIGLLVYAVDALGFWDLLGAAGVALVLLVKNALTGVG